MPPLLQAREPINKILASNPEIQGYDDATYVFTDISYGLSNRARKIVARDPDGVLREASWEEREKMCQIYFPAPGKKLDMPKMFLDNHFKDCILRGDYEFILDRACAQFEPDDPEYIRVTRTTYDSIDERRAYGIIQSTRHFGPMVLHLVLSKKMDDLMFYFISENDLNAGADLVRLFRTVESISSNVDLTNDSQLVEDYIKKHSLKKPILELAWETYLEIERQRTTINSPGNQQQISN
nr:EOG090X0AW0 [Polyphemus pediculus]